MRMLNPATKVLRVRSVKMETTDKLNEYVCPTDYQPKAGIRVVTIGLEIIPRFVIRAGPVQIRLAVDRDRRVGWIKGNRKGRW